MPAILSRRRFVYVAAGSAAIASYGRRAAAAQPGIGVYPIALPLYAHYFVAMGRGFFKDAGLDAQLVPAGSGVKMRDIVASGQGDVGIGDVTHPLQLTNRRRAARILNTIDRRSSSAMTVSADAYARGLTSLPQLATWKRPDGSKPLIGLSSIGGTSHVWSSYVLERLDLDQAVTFVGVGETDTMLGALKSRQIDVVVGGASMLAEATNRGWGRLLFDMGDPANWERIVGGAVPITANFTLAATIERDPACIQAFVTALYRAGRWIAANPADAVYDTIEPYVGATSRAANLIEIEAGRQAIDVAGTLDGAAYQRGGKIWFREMTGIKPMPIQSVYDPTFIERAHAAVPA
jgi:NitT/TauT family transport system substrate-binding protein